MQMDPKPDEARGAVRATMLFKDGSELWISSGGAPRDTPTAAAEEEEVAAEEGETREAT